MFGDLPGAETALRKAKELRERKLPGTFFVARTLETMARVFAQMGRPDETNLALEQANAILLKLNKVQGIDEAVLHHVAEARTYHAMGRPDRAVISCES